MLHSHSRAAVTASLIAACGFAFAASPSTLTLEEAQQRAIAHSRQLAGKDFAAIASRDMAAAAGQLPDPVLKLGIENLPAEGPDRFSLTRDSMTMQRFGVMQELTRPDKRRLRAQRFEREADKAIAEKQAATAVIQRETAIAWLDRFYADAMARLVGEQLEQARLAVEAAGSAYRAGRGSQAELIAARSALADLEDRASEAARASLNASVMLERWTGYAGVALGGRPDIHTIPFEPGTLESHLASHPEIVALASDEQIAMAEANLARANRKADWSIEVGYQRRGSAYGDMVSVGVSIPLQWDRKNRQDRELSARLATVEQARADRDEALRAHVAETRQLINTWQDNLVRLDRYEKELVPLARAANDALLAAYRGGKASLPDVLAARRNEIDTRLKALQLEAETARLWAQLNFLFPGTEK